MNEFAIGEKIRTGIKKKFLNANSKITFNLLAEPHQEHIFLITHFELHIVETFDLISQEV